MSNKIRARYSDSSRTWTIDLPGYGPGEAVTWIPYWVTHRLAHDLGPDFNVLDERGHLRITGDAFRGSNNDPCADIIARSLRRLLDGVDEVEVTGLPTEDDQGRGA